MSGPLWGTWPAVIDSYDQAARMCRVRIDGVTDGSNILPLAEIKYPVGDRADAANAKDHTEIRLLPGDPVYVEFLGGDERYPLITGSRLKRAGNPINWRRWRHTNIEMTADNELIINAAKVTWNVSGDVIEQIGGKMTTTVGGAMESTAGTSKHSAATHLLTAQTTIAGALTTATGPGGAGATFAGPVSYTGTTIKHNGVEIGNQHRHTAQGATAITTVVNV